MAMLFDELPRRFNTRWLPKAGLAEATNSALNPSGAKASAVKRASLSTPCRLSVKLLMPTICRSHSSPAGIRDCRNSRSDRTSGRAGKVENAAIDIFHAFNAIPLAL